jgi:ribosome-binding protein aMBF1 (putative translation factor)
MERQERELEREKRERKRVEADTAMIRARVEAVEQALKKKARKIQELTNVHASRPARQRQNTAQPLPKRKSGSPRLVEEVDPCDIAAVIRARIAADGWTSYALAKTSSVDTAVIQRFVSGERDIRLETATRLCRVLGLVLVDRDDHED